MLSKEVFLKQITILKVFYTRWNFNDKDATQMNVWYQAFSAVEDNDFERIISTFCRTHIHAPDSPNEILMILSEEEEKKWMNPEQAFNHVRDLIRDYGWQYGRKDIYSGVKNNPALLETVKEFEYDLRELTVNDQFIPKRFKDAYAIKLKTMCIKKRDEKLRLAASQPAGAIESKTIGNALPYEV